MAYQFHSAWRRVKRAEKFIEELDAGITAFFDGKPYADIMEPLGDGEHVVHKVKLTKSLPDDLTDIAADAADNLRSALDLAAYAVSVSANNQKPQNTHFPFANTESDVRVALSKGRSKDIPPGIGEVMVKFQPHKGGNNALWALNRLRNTNQHKFLVPMGFLAGGMDVNMRIKARNFEMFGPQWDPENNEIILSITDDDAEFRYHYKLEMHVVFGEVEFFSGLPAVPSLKSLSIQVSDVITAIETESQRTNLFG